MIALSTQSLGDKLPMYRYLDIENEKKFPVCFVFLLCCAEASLFSTQHKEGVSRAATHRGTVPGAKSPTSTPLLTGGRFLVFCGEHGDGFSVR